MIGHTPWKASQDEFSIFVEDAEGRIVADVRPNGMTMAGHQAQAHLIAAAPELLEALKHLCGFIDREGPASKEWKAITEWCERGNAAIAKAEGK